MTNYLYALFTSMGVMGILDAVWLSKIAPAFYKKHLGFIMADKPNMVAALAFYVIFAIGLTVFVVYPGWKDVASLVKIGLFGALFGFVTYATYDLTNQATLKNWPHIVTFIDLAWGTVLTATVSVVAVVLLRQFIK